MIDPRTLVVTIDAYDLPEEAWLVIKTEVNERVDLILRSYCHGGPRVVRRSDDVNVLLGSDDDG